VRTLTGPVTAGFHRVSWDLREPAPTLPRPRPAAAEDDPFAEEPAGPLVMPGTYRVSLARRVGGVVTPVPGEQEFAVVVDANGPGTSEDRKALFEFQEKVTRLQRAVAGTLEAANAVTGRLEQIRKALDQTPTAEPKWKDQARLLEQRNRDILRALRGDVALRSLNENTPVSIVERVQRIVDDQRQSLARPTRTQQDGYAIASQEFTQELAKLRTLVEVDLKDLERNLDLSGAPWTPGRLPEWKEK
jgi:hypothetical protein